MNQAQVLRSFIDKFNVSILNVAGPENPMNPAFIGSYLVLSIKRSATPVSRTFAKMTPE